MIYKPWYGGNQFAKSYDYTREFFDFIDGDAPESLKMDFFTLKKFMQIDFEWKKWDKKQQ